jgi:hypothetical protein
MKKSLLTLALVALSAVASYAQGTIQFSNNGLSAVKYQDVLGGAIVNAPDGCVIGVYWGATADALTLQTPTTTTFTSGGVSGLYNGGGVYALTGSNPGQAVFMKIAGWLTKGGTTPATINGGIADPRITHYGESAVVQTLGLAPTAGPGIVVVQGPAGTTASRTKPFTIAPVPEPSVIALGALGLGALLLRRRKA